MIRPALALAALASLWVSGWLLLSLAVLQWWTEVQWVKRRGAIVVWVSPPVPPSTAAYMASRGR